MRQTQLFTKTRKDAPKDEVSQNAQLLIRAGYIHKEMAGVYSMLPLGLRVLNKIEAIIREEMNAVQGQEVEMTTLQDKQLWERAGKWDDAVVDVWFKTKLKNDTELGLAFSHEEVFAEMLREHINSYKDLPLSVYQFQKKFRNELRAKSGIMRGREFLMKDMYSFHASQEDLDAYFETVKDAYVRVFERVGLGAITYITEADGSVFGERSLEFQTLSDAGEDTIFYNADSKLAINEEVMNDEVVSRTGLDKKSLTEGKSIEVGNIFPIDDIISKKMDFTFMDDQGKPQPIYMASYGIGIGRVMGTVVEALADEKGIVWPESVAPFAYHLLLLNPNDADVVAAADDVYQQLTAQGIEVLYDDRDLGAGQKFADSELLGMPQQIVVSKKMLEQNVVEVQNRKSGEKQQMSVSELLQS